MGKRPLTKMSLDNRAKQFAPFPMEGLKELLSEKEITKVKKIVLSEDMEILLDQQLHNITIGGMVSVTYYNRGEYLKKTGVVARFDETCRNLQIVQTKIRFEDILEIEFPD